jgi:mRNA-degrading endonuclease RelE of RelBE toxin-antitoxin system
MNYKIILTSNFQREFKRLNKKYPSLKSDLIELSDSLLKQPVQGSEVFKNCYKIRFAIKSKGKRKSGGGRLINYIQIVSEKIYFLSVYDKSEKETVSDQDIKRLLNDL